MQQCTCKFAVTCFCWCKYRLLLLKCYLKTWAFPLVHSLIVTQFSFILVFLTRNGTVPNLGEATYCCSRVLCLLASLYLFYYSFLFFLFFLLDIFIRMPYNVSCVALLGIACIFSKFHCIFFIHLYKYCL